MPLGLDSCLDFCSVSDGEATRAASSAAVMPPDAVEEATGGKVRRTVRPPPGVSLIRAVPPCAAMTEATMARPRPDPPDARDREESVLKKRSKSRSESSGSTPGPWSRTSTTASSPCLPRAISTGVPAGVWLRTLESRLVTTWMTLSESA